MFIRIYLLLLVLPLMVHSRFSHFDVVQAPQSEPDMLQDVIETDGSAVYSDEDMRLTGVKDDMFHACFITNFDPEWNLDLDEKQELIDTMEPEIVRSVHQFENLKLRTGDMIASMCKKSKIYWLTTTHSEPMHSSGSSNAQHERKPALPVPKLQPQAVSHKPVLDQVADRVLSPSQHNGHVQIPQHVPAHSPGHVPQHIPGHSPAHIPQHVPVHGHVLQHGPGHFPVHIPQHVPVHPPVHVPQHSPVHVPDSEALHAPQRIPVRPEPQAMPQGLPQLQARKLPDAPKPNPVPVRLPFIRPRLPDRVSIKRTNHGAQHEQQNPMPVPKRLSMEHPKVVPRDN